MGKAFLFLPQAQQTLKKPAGKGGAAIQQSGPRLGWGMCSASPGGALKRHEGTFLVKNGRPNTIIYPCSPYIPLKQYGLFKKKKKKTQQKCRQNANKRENKVLKIRKNMGE